VTVTGHKSHLVREDDELGPERYCARCDEWWPEDAEFWVIQRQPAGKLAWWRRGRAYIRRTSTTSYTCRACRREQQAIYGKRKRAAA
jgi:hypothetical protein